MKNIRNFCIIAHIDHGKSTIADGLLEFTKTIEKRDLKAQLLDNMDLAREPGITIKSHAIQMIYSGKDGIDYTLNLIDTPGHEAFVNLRKRGGAVADIAILVVDVLRGFEAQTYECLDILKEKKGDLGGLDL